jgi:serine/threonine-protein kinase
MVCPNCGEVTENKYICEKCGVELGPAIASIASDSNGAPSPATISPLSASGALTGKTLDHKYYLESKLGVGGMGTVYRAGRLLIGDWVAVKVLHPDQMTDPQAVERFRREAQTAARLKHPNIVALYDFAISREGLNYQVMELAEGESLRSMVDRQGTLAETDAAEIINQVCAALDEAHRQGVVHRDIKPENILVQTTSDGMLVKVLDFGIASLRDINTDRLTRTGAIVGTPHYMSPEHCLGEELDGRSDIYSLGIVLYEILTGIVPFDSPTPTAIIIKHVNDPPPPPRALNPKISPEVELVALRALEKLRDARPQTAGELATELLVAAGGAAPAPPPPAVVAEPEAVTPMPIPALVEAPPPESNDSAAPATYDTPAFGEISAKTGSGGRLVLLVFVALLLMVGGGLWWYLRNFGIENATATNNPAEDSQRGATAGGQPAPLKRGATVSPSTSPAEAESAPASNKSWGIIPSQTIGVTDAANASGVADRRIAVISPGGQLALEYREGKFFGDGQGADLHVYGPEQGRVSYLIFVKNDPAEDWVRIGINQKGFPRRETGHDMGHHGVRQARQVMIQNTGKTDLRIDAISVVYKY